jgi:hypothetical protein
MKTEQLTVASQAEIDPEDCRQPCVMTNAAAFFRMN